jgi:hypothetical protein
MDWYRSSPFLVWLLVLYLAHILPCFLLIAWVYANRTPSALATIIFVLMAMAIWIGVDWSGVVWPLSFGYAIENIPYLYWIGQTALLVCVGVATTLFQQRRV